MHIKFRLKFYKKNERVNEISYFFFCPCCGKLGRELALKIKVMLIEKALKNGRLRVSKVS